MSPIKNGFPSSLLRVPLFYKIMVANLAIVAGVAIVGGRFGFLGGIAVVVVNAVILRLALHPLETLEETAARVQAGDLSQRAEPSVLADREMQQLVETFNKMLDTIDDARARQRDLSIRALRAGEEERRRVAADLHDKTAQTLAGLLVQLSLLKSADESMRTKLIEDASEQAAFAMNEVYRVVQGLRPPALELLGLRGAIEAHARTLHVESGIAIDVIGDDVRGALDAEAEIATYRILQEALSNVIRHSKATHATITLRRMPDGVVVTIEDNGVGFESEETMRSAKSLGLFGMQERASYLGGRVEIRSDGKGTAVEVIIPVTEEI